VYLFQMMCSVSRIWSAIPLLLLLPLLSYSKVIPWSLDYPDVSLKDGRITVNITGTSAVKKMTFVMSRNKKVTYGKPSTKFKLICNQDLECSGSGGPIIGITDKVYYGMIVVTKDKNNMKFKNKIFARLPNFKSSKGVLFDIAAPTRKKNKTDASVQ
ncbi:unnamed protein product, partial [Meganyctiphanes norvegica]